MIRSPARLMEVFPETIIAAVALDAIRLGAISFDAVKQLTIADMARRPAKLDLCDYPYMHAANVRTPCHLFSSRLCRERLRRDAWAKNPRQR